MSRLNWGAVGERFYEAGVDRGVLYVDSNPGVPWVGLISVSQTTKGGETKPYYIDGVKYLNRSMPQEFEADIEAYTYPDEFAACEGTATHSYGLFSTHGKRKSFGLAYRSLIGNDINGTEHGYKIHLIYGARAEPSNSDYTTLGEDTEALNFSWHITTKPPLNPDRLARSHFVIDSRITPTDLLSLIEDILYGSETKEARLPTVDELFYWFESYHSSIFSAGDPDQPSYVTFDGGVVPELQTTTIDGGVP